MGDERGMYGLKPPEKLRQLNAEEYKKWKQRFEIYRTASGARSQDEEIQVALLLHCMGEESLEIFNTLELSEEEKKVYDTVINRFDQYFIPIKNESVAAHIFFTRQQKTNETFDAYLTELRRLAQDCEFGNLQDRLLRDRIVAGILDSKLKDRLLREADLTLQKAIKICKAAELATERIKEIEEKSVAIDRIGGRPEKKQMSTNIGGRQETKHALINKGRYYQEQNQASTSKGRYYQEKNQASTSKGGYQEKKQPFAGKECTRCGFVHNFGNCPAYGKTCLKCKKLGHFARKCRAGYMKIVKTVLQDSEESQEEEVWLGTVHIQGEKEWTEKINFVEQQKSVIFKLDTGAQCNILPEKECKRLGLTRLEKSKLKLLNYNGDVINTLGQVTIKCSVGNMVRFINFQVCEGSCIPILGLQTLTSLNLIKRVPVSEKEILQITTGNNDLILKYKDVFDGLGEIKGFEYKIALKQDWVGKIEPARHVPFKLMNRLKTELSNLEKIGVISKVEKPTDFVSSLVIVSKPDGSLRVCLDPQYLNTQIKREQIQIPTVEEITSKLSGSKIFSTLDASKAFFMLKLSDDSKELTTFNTPYGRYHYNRLPFGLSSSPEVFHRVYKNIFSDIQGVEIYIDDLLIHAKNETEHDKILEKVLQRAQETGIKFNKTKCNFKQKEVRYLGHILTTEGMKVDKDRIRAIVEMKEPETQKELLRFLGMINYVSRFIPNVSEITAPLRQLIKKNVPFIWSQSQQTAYDKLKRILIEPPVLTYFDLNKDLVLSVDASKDGLGAVLLQEGRPVAYGSRAMTSTEKNFSQIEKESLAILYGCTKFHQYLYGQQFRVETDHKPLVSIFSKPLNKSPARLQRIRIALQPYTFELKYKPGRELLVADHLSRSYLCDTTKSYDIDIEAHVAMVVQSFKITDKKLQELIEETAKDKELIKVCKYIREGWPINKYDIDSEAKIYYTYRDELGECEGLVMKGSQIVIPQSKRKEILEKIHYAHLGVEKCKKLARKTLFWPNMSKEIEDMIQKCNTCLSFQNNNRKETMIDKEIPNKPWQIVATDIFFLYRVPYLLVVDAYSKYIEIQELKNLTAQDTIESLKTIFARHGIPELVYSDSGSQFTGQEFKSFTKFWNFEHKVVSAKYHQSNGLAERHIQTIKRTLKKLIYDRKDIYLGLLIYRNIPVTESGKSPAELLFNRTVRNILPTVETEWKKDKGYKKVLIERQAKQRMYYNRGCRNLPELTNGEVVKIQDENNRKPHSSGIVVGLGEGPRSYKIKNEKGEIITRNRKMLIKGGIYKKQINYDDLDIDLEGTEGSSKENRQESNKGVEVECRQSMGNVDRNHYTTRTGRIIKKPSYLRDYV